MARNHKYAQHFLRSPRVVAELIGHSNIRKNDIVYDLGAGSGVIASVLARRAKYVIAVEIESAALRKLHENLDDVENVEIVERDILSLKQPEGRYKIFSNIPFSMSADVVRKFCFDDNPPISMYLIVQKQFARKLVPGDDHFTSQLSAQIAPWFSVRIRKPLRKTDFTPPPAVDTVLLEIKRREEMMIELKSQTDYVTFVEQCFSRQKYFSALKREEAGVSPEKLPSQLTSDEWVKLFKSAAR